MGEKGKIAAIIQARMTSTRLPGKVLMPCMERPLLSYLIERLRFSKYLDEIIIATTVNAEDEAIVLFAEGNGLPFYRGSEADVLDRYYRAAQVFGVDHILRVTSDCPLIDPRLCDRVIDAYRTSDVDYVHTGPTFAEGLDCEVFSFAALEQAWREASLVSEREHLTLYLHNHPELFKKMTMVNETDDSRYRFSVDEEEDYVVVKAILEGLYKENAEPFPPDEIKAFLDNNPSVAECNAHIIRNEGLVISLQNDRTISRSESFQTGHGEE